MSWARISFVISAAACYWFSRIDHPLVVRVIERAGVILGLQSISVFFLKRFGRPAVARAKTLMDKS